MPSDWRPFALRSPICEADLWYPRIGAHPSSISLTPADLTPASDGTPIVLGAPIDPRYAEDVAVTDPVGDLRVYAEYDRDFTEEVDVVIVGVRPQRRGRRQGTEPTLARVWLSSKRDLPSRRRSTNWTAPSRWRAPCARGGLRTTRGTVMPTMQADRSRWWIPRQLRDLQPGSGIRPGPLVHGFRAGTYDALGPRTPLRRGGRVSGHRSDSRERTGRTQPGVQARL